VNTRHRKRAQIEATLGRRNVGVNSLFRFVINDQEAVRIRKNLWEIHDWQAREGEVSLRLAYRMPGIKFSERFLTLRRSLSFSKMPFGSHFASGTPAKTSEMRAGSHLAQLAAECKIRRIMRKRGMCKSWWSRPASALVSAQLEDRRNLRPLILDILAFCDRA
jgi:hypothetical protein